MIKPRIALISFAESREDMFEKRRHMFEEEIHKVRSRLSLEHEVAYHGKVNSWDTVDEAIRGVRASDVDVAILHLPIWSFPALVISCARLLDVPVLLLANAREETSSIGGMLGAGGGLDMAGIPHKRVVCNGPEDRDAIQKVNDFCRAATVLHRLRGQRFGCFGGRSLGIYTTAASLATWQRVFGVDIEHLDQLMIQREAERIPDVDVEPYLSWFSENVNCILSDGMPEWREALKRQIRSYVATRRLIKQNRLDFVGIKCQRELSDGYVLQCLNVAMLNDPYDPAHPADPIEPTVCACEADHDGALTMQILKMISGGQPTSLMDIRLRSAEGLLVLANCGAAASFFAARSTEAKDNWGRVTLMPNVFGFAGGFTTQYIYAPGKVTLARLCQKDGRYWMAIMVGNLVLPERGEVPGVVKPWPHAFFEANLDFEELWETYGANHIHVVYGDHVGALEDFCRLLGIEARVYTR
ncbi:MAG TPA: hypothetical protein GXX51_01965 [Firmicutes bacterium]|nr:hypothetical protein [Bacillota bacterium]